MNLKAAVIGLGFVGRAHLEALRRRGIGIAGVLQSSAERTAKAVLEAGVVHGYQSLAELAADPSVDVAHICTPNHLHREMAQALLAAGKHVICEKPLAMNTAEGRTLVQAANQNHRVAAVAYNLRYYPLCQEARVRIQQGAIGEPRLVHGGFLQDWLLFPSDWNWRLEPELGGSLRAISDIGTHWLDLATWLTGRKVTEVCADLATVIPVRQKPRGRVETFQKSQAEGFDDVRIQTDDYGSVLLHFEANTRGVMTVSQVSAGRKARLWFEIDGSEGSLAWNSEEPNTLWLGRRQEPNGLLIKDPALMTPAARGFAAYPGGHTEGYPDTFAQLFKDVYGYIAAGNLIAERPFPTFQTGLDELILCDAIAQSSKERRWVKI